MPDTPSKNGESSRKAKDDRTYQRVREGVSREEERHAELMAVQQAIAKATEANAKSSVAIAKSSSRISIATWVYGIAAALTLGWLVIDRLYFGNITATELSAIIDDAVQEIIRAFGNSADSPQQPPLQPSPQNATP